MQECEESQAPRRAAAATGSKLPTAVRLHHGKGAPEWMTSKQTGQPRLDVNLNMHVRRENMIYIQAYIRAKHSQTNHNITRFRANLFRVPPSIVPAVPVMLSVGTVPPSSIPLTWGFVPDIK